MGLDEGGLELGHLLLAGNSDAVIKRDEVLAFGNFHGNNIGQVTILLSLLCRLVGASKEELKDKDARLKPTTIPRKVILLLPGDPELVDTDEWKGHADKWFRSIDVKHEYSKGDPGIPKYADGTPFVPNFSIVEALKTVKDFAARHSDVLDDDVIEKLVHVPLLQQCAHHA